MVLVDDTNTAVDGVVFGSGGSPNTSFSGGVLNGQNLATVESNLGPKEAGSGPFAIDENGNVTANPNPDPAVPCFLEGTLILTPEGERPVETLARGDVLTTADGGRATVAWMGRKVVLGAFAVPERLSPVRIRAGALGDRLPHTDLLVTAEHGILVGNVMVNAGALVNGTTIVRETSPAILRRYVVWHVETENQEVIVANGVAAETFLDNASRAMFDNAEEAQALGIATRAAEELSYPRVMSARQVPPAIRRLLAERAAASEDLSLAG